MSDLEISPPPRTKRNSLPRKIEDSSAAKKPVVPNKNVPNNNKKFVLPPKSSNVITTGHYKSIGNNNNNRLPPPHPPQNPNSGQNLTSQIVRNSRKNGSITNNQEEHIYESLDIKRPPLPAGRESKTITISLTNCLFQK